jgi:hypothetical protein
VTYQTRYLDLLDPSFELVARTPDAQRFLNGWKDPVFWTELADHYTQVRDERGSGSFDLRSTFQCERDMLCRAAIDAAEHIHGLDREAYALLVKQAFLADGSLFEDLSFLKERPLKTLLNDQGAGGCMELLDLLTLLHGALNPSDYRDISSGFGPVMNDRHLAHLMPMALATPDPICQLLTDAEQEAVAWFAILHSVTHEYRGSQIPEAASQVFCLLRRVASPEGMRHSALWQYLPLLDGGLAFAAECNLDINQSARIALFDNDALRMRSLYWDTPAQCDDDQLMAAIEAMEEASNVEEVLLTISFKNRQNSVQRQRVFARHYVREHLEQFRVTDFTAKEFDNLFSLLDSETMASHRDASESMKEAALGRDLGL